jgi:Zn-dependent peptidase ImmA (M78 family)
MDQLNEFIKSNPKMKLDEISKIYGISVSAISKRRASLGIKHETTEICKKIASMLDKRNIEIARELGCTEQLVASVRFKSKKEKMNRRIELTAGQIKVVKANFDKKGMTIAKLAEKIGVTNHVLRSRMIEMKLYKDTYKSAKFYDYDLDNGNGFFDLEKYKKIML